MKKIIILLFSLVLILCFTFSVSALSLTSYADISPTSSNVQNLINKAINFRSFDFSDYIVFQSSQYSYVLVWGQLSKSGNFITGSDVEVLQYVRTGTVSNYKYEYFYSEQADFSLEMNHQVVSNLEGVGFSSPVFENFNYQLLITSFSVIITAFIFAITVLNFRRTY